MEISLQINEFFKKRALLINLDKNLLSLISKCVFYNNKINDLYHLS